MYISTALWTVDGRSARCKAATYTQNKHGQTSMPRVELEPTIPVFERAKTVYALDCPVTVIGYAISVQLKFLLCGYVNPVATMFSYCRYAKSLARLAESSPVMLCVFRREMAVGGTYGTTRGRNIKTLLNIKLFHLLDLDAY
jgi:hypothetical protein